MSETSWYCVWVGFRDHCSDVSKRLHPERHEDCGYRMRPAFGDETKSMVKESADRAAQQVLRELRDGIGEHGPITGGFKP